MEQDRKSRRGGAQDIRPEVLRYRAAAAKPREGRPYLLIVLGLVIMAAGVGAGILLMGKRGEPVAISGGATTLPVSAPTASVPTPQPAPAPLLPEPAPAAALAAPTPAPAASAEQAPPVAAPLPSGGAKPVRRGGVYGARPETGVPTPSKPLQRETVEDINLPIPDITISGIAYQDERGLRRAVLNGSLVGEGAEVAGARVVEIRENKVRLSKGGRIFEVVFSGGSR